MWWMQRKKYTSSFSDHDISYVLRVLLDPLGSNRPETCSNRMGPWLMRLKIIWTQVEPASAEFLRIQTNI